MTQGQRAHADVVTVYQKIIGVSTGIVTTNLQSTQISQSSFNGTVTGPRGAMSNFNGRVTTVTPTSTPMIYAIPRYQYEHFASFWMKPASADLKSANAN
jgi:hypothetical protein